MSHLRFSDGISFDTSGALRLAIRSDGMYVIGQGLLVPVRDEVEGWQLIENIRKTEEGPRVKPKAKQAPQPGA